MAGASTNYDILTTIRIADQATGAARAITAQTTGMTGQMFKAVTGANLVSSAITRAFNSAARAVSGLANELIGLNKEFEDQRLALTALINANIKYQDAAGQPMSPAQNLTASVGVAEEQLRQFVEAAKTAPGTARDFSQIGQFMIDPYLKAGGQMGQQFTDIIKKILIAGQFTGQSQEVTALDAQQIMQGLAKSRDRLPKLLGLDPATLNKMKPDERLKEFYESLSRVVTPETMALLEDSYTTVRATFSDLVGIIKRVAGNRAFEAIKNTLKGFNSFLESHGKTLTEALGAIIDVFMAVGAGLGSVAEYFAKPLVAMIEYLGSGTAQAEDLKNRLGATFKALLDSIDAFFAALVGNSYKHGSDFGESLNAILKVVKGFVDYFTLAVTALSAPFNLLIGYIQAVASAIYMIKAGGLAALPEAGGLLMDGLKEATEGVGKDISDATRRIVTPIPGKLPGAPGAGDAAQTAAGMGKAAVPNVTQNFNGGITIKQEFKDNADPDRIAFKVREVFDKLKERPLTSRKRFSLGVA